MTIITIIAKKRTQPITSCCSTWCLIIKNWALNFGTFPQLCIPNGWKKFGFTFSYEFFSSIGQGNQMGPFKERNWIWSFRKHVSIFFHLRLSNIKLGTKRAIKHGVTTHFISKAWNKWICVSMKSIEIIKTCQFFNRNSKNCGN